jgi:chromosome segregation ATPase
MNENSSIDTHNQKNKIDKHNPNNHKLIDDDDFLEEMEKELAKKDDIIIQLNDKVLDSMERIHEVIIEKRNLEKQVKEYELKELILQFNNFEKLKNDHNKLEHRLIITKNHLDNARNQINFQKEFVDNAKEQIEFMERVIEDLENRNLIDFIRNKFPETFIEYKKK